MMHRIRPGRFAAALAGVAATLLFLGAPLATTPLQDLTERLYSEQPAGQIGLAACDLGDSFVLPAKGISRVTVDNASILKVRAVDGGRSLEISCNKSGTSIMTVTRYDIEYSVAVNVPRVTDTPIDGDSDRS